MSDRPSHRLRACRLIPISPVPDAVESLTGQPTEVGTVYLLQDVLQFVSDVLDTQRGYAHRYLYRCVQAP